MDFLWHILATIGLTLPTVLGYNVVFGKGKILHFGQEGTVLFASYATFLTLRATDSWTMALLAGVVAVTALSLLLSWLALRLEPDGFAVLSISVHLILLALVLNWTELTRGALGLPAIPRIGGLESAPVFALASLGVSGLWFLVLLWIDRSPFGRALQALAEHPWHAQALGVSRSRIYTIAFLLAGVGALLSGLIYPMYIHLLHPNDYTFPWLIILVMMIVAGRPGSVLGVTLSTILLVCLKEGLRFVPLPNDVLGAVRLLLFGCILLTAVWVRRDKLFPPLRSI